MLSYNHMLAASEVRTLFWLARSYCFLSGYLIGFSVFMQHRSQPLRFLRKLVIWLSVISTTYRYRSLAMTKY